MRVGQTPLLACSGFGVLCQGSLSDYRGVDKKAAVWELVGARVNLCSKCLYCDEVLIEGFFFQKLSCKIRSEISVNLSKIFMLSF